MAARLSTLYFSPFLLVHPVCTYTLRVSTSPSLHRLPIQLTKVQQRIIFILSGAIFSIRMFNLSKRILYIFEKTLAIIVKNFSSREKIFLSSRTVEVETGRARLKRGSSRVSKGDHFGNDNILIKARYNSRPLLSRIIITANSFSLSHSSILAPSSNDNSSR